ncbi:MAG: LasA protease [Chloroflexota bacterium]|nr:LasA protease [Chloroflexota bacterium]
MKIAFTHKRITAALAVLMISAPILGACSAAAAQPTPAPTPQSTATPVPTATATPLPGGYVEYTSQSGDTLVSIARHFGVRVGDITDISEREATRMIAPGAKFMIKDVLVGETTRPDWVFPDSAIVYSPAAALFDPYVFQDEQLGYISVYTETMMRGQTSATEIIYEMGLDYSINPEILLTILEREGGWLSNPKPDIEHIKYCMGWQKADRGTVYYQTGWAIHQLMKGYYGWRSGKLTELTFIDGSTLRLSPYLNAGTVAVMYTLAQTHDRAGWEDAMYGENSLAVIHTQYFGDAFELGAGIDPIFSADVQQPELNLPYPPNEVWNLTGGPHAAWGSGWEDDYALAALDFAPPLDSPGCGNSTHYATAAAAGLVVRAGNGVVVIDLDGDGLEQTGWVLVYMHMANSDRVNVGDYLNQDDIVGHPSCEGGSSSGIHLHIVRKYNGEWVLADGGLPFVMSGYCAHDGEKYYEGYVENGKSRVTANIAGNYWTRIIRPDSRPEFFYTPTPKK